MTFTKPSLDSSTESLQRFRCAWCEKTMSAVSVSSAQEVNYGMCRACLGVELNRLSREDVSAVVSARNEEEESPVWTAAV